MTIKKWDLKQKDRLLPMNPGFEGNVTQKRITTSFSLFGKKILLMIISQISFCLNTERQSSTILSLVTTLFFLDHGIAISGASISSLRLVLTLFWAFEDETLTYAALPAGADLTNRQQKWKLLDKRILGLTASIIDDLPLSHVAYDWTDPLTFPSISKRPLGQAKDFLWHHWLCSRLSSLQASPTQTRSHSTCSDRYHWHDVTPRSHNPSWVDPP